MNDNNNFNLDNNNQAPNNTTNDNSFNNQPQNNIVNPKKNMIAPIFITIFIVIASISAVVFFTTKGKNTTKSQNNTNTNTESTNYSPQGEEGDVTLIAIGQYDHGKTPLTSAITKYYGDYVNEETIDNAIEEIQRGVFFRNYKVNYNTKKRKYLQYDFPSNIDIVKALLSDAVNPDGAILVVSELDGPMPNTRTQLALAKEIGIKKIVVYLNDCDKATNKDLIDLVESEIRDLIFKYGFDKDKTPIIRGSASKALEGKKEYIESIDKLMNAVDEWIPNHIDAKDKQLLLPIEDVFTITGRGTVITGRIETGTIKNNDEVEIVGSKNTQKTVITSIKKNQKESDSAEAGDNVVIVLKDIKREEVSRGQVIAKIGSLKAYNKFSAHIYIYNEKENGNADLFKDNNKLNFYFRTTDFPGTIKLSDKNKNISPGDDIELDVELDNSVAMDLGTKFFIRNEGKTIGVGVVTKTS
ncbi:MAG: GTP-binding protein [Bacilli bacterium]|nr:GTP-binding protein [Bacilli bacterium]